mgnify:CR=1 FL=1
MVPQTLLTDVFNLSREDKVALVVQIQDNLKRSVHYDLRVGSMVKFPSK